MCAGYMGKGKQSKRLREAYRREKSRPVGRLCFALLAGLVACYVCSQFLQIVVVLLGCAFGSFALLLLI